ncbi:hypothetical protein HEP87_59920 [Streptomyces sp. S1D4-11]
MEEGQKKGVFSTATPADLVVDYHFGSVHHLSTWYRPNGPSPPSRSPTTWRTCCCARCGHSLSAAGGGPCRAVPRVPSGARGTARSLRGSGGAALRGREWAGAAGAKSP